METVDKCISSANHYYIAAGRPICPVVTQGNSRALTNGSRRLPRHERTAIPPERSPEGLRGPDAYPVMNVLIVEDDDSVARFLQQAITEAGYAGQVVRNGAIAHQQARRHDFDLILLDVMLPGMDGFEVCRRLRAADVTTPILIITARDTLDDKIEGLDSGADDYIVKPFQIAELLARARAILRRGSPLPTVLRVSDLTLDPNTRRASRGGRSVLLS